ncbi:trihelix transcription factor ENAP1 [Beta vulgaris subsp. vulgaris]|uniref:trihelix transcription factor ENAP1 n=1 Tax=Beta vulgaris subsp. vulgaris TaxID=3555 RepID=UPI00203721BD|nr:trihelix transcription factor ENAP1 [Beta vulgaris subsp. vulgaris]
MSSPPSTTTPTPPLEPTLETPPPPSPPAAPPALPAAPPPIIQALSYSPLKKPQPIPWSHEETLNLIKAYQEKWYSLKRGQLKASQWEEVSVTVAARCGFDEPSKSGTQCRHKIEKLRKRYRAEKLKLAPCYISSNFTHPWIYFSLMDHLERGPLPISAVPPNFIDNNNNNNNNNLVDSDDDDDDDDGDGGVVKYASLGKLREFDHKRVDGFSKTENGYVGLNKRKSYWGGNQEDKLGFQMEEDEEEGGDDEVEEERENKGSLMGELGAQMRVFSESFVKMERKKMELMRETERFRMEMENKRIHMIHLFQHKTVELISKAFSDDSSFKKMKINPDL